MSGEWQSAHLFCRMSETGLNSAIPSVTGSKSLDRKKFEIGRATSITRNKPTRISALSFAFFDMVTGSRDCLFLAFIADTNQSPHPERAHALWQQHKIAVCHILP